MKKSYLYPISARANKDNYNPYVDNFMDSLQSRFVFLNRNNPSDTGIGDLFKYIRKINYVWFHWPENIAERKYGFIQGILFFVLLIISKIRNVKIIYVVHNKISHTKNNLKFKSLIAKTLIKYSDLLITHSRDGIDFINSLVKKDNNIFYFPHPVVDERPFPVVRKDIDLLIWGNIAPYKGIHRFLETINDSEFSVNYKIMIAGKFDSESYFQKLNSFSIKNIELKNHYIDDELLRSLINRSKIVLFPYHSDTVLSSGAFAKSVIFPVDIIGPECGSFNDFSYMDNINTFQNEDQMIRLIESRLALSNNNINSLSDEIIEKYSWQKFGNKLIEVL